MSMTLSKYLKEVFSRDLHLSRSWRLQAFAIKEKYINDPYYPVPTDKGVGFMDDEGIIIELDNIAKPAYLTPILPHYTQFTMLAEDMDILSKDVSTRIGIVLLNEMTFTPFHPRYPFVNEIISPKILTQPFLMDIESGNNDDEFNAKFIDVMSSLETILAADSEFILRSIVEGQFVWDKKHEELRDSLIKKNSDNLEDPLAIADIQGKIAASSKKRYEEMGATLWQGGKSHSVTLSKTEGAYGSEMSIEESNSKYVVKSLREGVAIEDIPTHVGVARYGSFGRGKLTALGGAAVNDAYRALESRQCSIDNCKTTRGAPRRIREHNYRLYVGQALAGTTAFLTEAMLKLYIGKTILIRTPSKCMAGVNDVCRVCGGKDISRIPESIPTKASGFMSTLMSVSMASSHGAAAMVTRIDFMDDVY